MTVLLEKQKIALERLDKTRRSCREKLRRHAVDIAEGHSVGEMLTEIVIEGGSAVPAGGKMFCSRITLSRCGEGAPHAGTDHGTGGELVGISTRQKILRARVGSRVLQRGVAFESGEIRKAVQQIAHDLHPPAISGIGAIGLPMAVISAVALVAYGRGRIPFDPIQMPFFNNVSQLLLDPRHNFGIAETQLLSGSERRMHGPECLPIDHRPPIRWNLARFHPCCIHVPRIHPQSEFQARAMYRIGKILDAVRKLLLALLKAAETKRPVVHAGN